jgi:4'-phosphopantetheinyl transferase
MAFPDELGDPSLLERYRALMSPEELAKEKRFRFESSRRECVVTRALVRTTLSRYAHVAPEAWRFESGPHGRPELVPGQCCEPLRFNLSHTDGLIACAVALGRDIGIDVETTERPGETVAIADRFFSPSEVRDLHALPMERQRPRFFDYWTLKEAYIKARGFGLALPLEQFSFHITGEGPIRISFDPRLEDDPETWQFARYCPTPTHVLAVAVRKERDRPLTIEVARTTPLLG